MFTWLKQIHHFSVQQALYPMLIALCRSRIYKSQLDLFIYGLESLFGLDTLLE